MYNEQSSSLTADAALEAQESHNDQWNPNPDQILATVQPTGPNALHEDANSSTTAQLSLMNEAKEQVHEEEEKEEETGEDADRDRHRGCQVGEHAGDDEKEEQDQLEECMALQEDEATRNYMPSFIQDLINEPPVPPGMSEEVFDEIFRSTCEDFMPPHRPKTDAEFFAAYRAAMAIIRILWLDRKISSVAKINQRSATEALHLKMYAVVPSSKKEKYDLERQAKEGAMDYFSSTDYRNNFNEMLKRGGFGTGAVEAEAFQRAAPALTVIERMRKSAIKERDEAYAELRKSYSQRRPNHRMPLSGSAVDRFNNNELREAQEIMDEAADRRRQQLTKGGQGGDP